MTLVLTQSVTAVGVLGPAAFGASGGVEPYLYEVLTGGAGGTINATTGLYTGPAAAPSIARRQYDTIQVTDYASMTAEAQILVGTPLILVTDILQRELGLANGRVYLWDQKLLQPSDSGLYIAVGIGSARPFSNINKPVSAAGALNEGQSVNMLAVIDIDIISRDMSAVNRKEEVILALNSVYAERQMEANGFYIAKIPTRFINLSHLDGAAIPYRFRISANMQYMFSKTKETEFYDDFEGPEIITDPEPET